jgi:hypothetical protein
MAKQIRKTTKKMKTAKLPKGVVHIQSTLIQL